MRVGDIEIIFREGIMDKTIYILGAGFSKGLGAPIQSEIIKYIFEITPNDYLPDIYYSYRNEIATFLEESFFISRDQFPDISLEDVYTPLDRCIIDNGSFRNINKSKLLEIRQKINALIIMMLQHKLKNVPHDNYIDKFAKYLVKIKRNMKNYNDPFAIISLNWDILIDNALFNEIDPKKGVVDYCCHITPYNPNKNIEPGLLARGKGKYNIKLLKIHGSLNWLQCIRCQRLFVTFDEKIAVNEFLTIPDCRLCNKNFPLEKINGDKALLVSQLIMPTFLKDLNNVQLKLMWQNAGIELSEANKIVFLGYSFPAADFELRQLLARSVRHNAEIEFVLRHNDIPVDEKVDSPAKRFRNFFGKRKVTPFYEGVEEYINTLTNAI